MKVFLHLTNGSREYELHESWLDIKTLKNYVPTPSDEFSSVQIIALAVDGSTRNITLMEHYWISFYGKHRSYGSMPYVAFQQMPQVLSDEEIEWSRTCHK